MELRPRCLGTNAKRKTAIEVKKEELCEMINWLPNMVICIWIIVFFSLSRRIEFYSNFEMHLHKSIISTLKYISLNNENAKQVKEDNQKKENE